MQTGSEVGALLVDGLGDGVAVSCPSQDLNFLRNMSFGVLQGSRMRNTKTGDLIFISYLTVWGVEAVVTPQTSWLESTGVCGDLIQHLLLLPETSYAMSAASVLPNTLAII